MLIKKEFIDNLLDKVRMEEVIGDFVTLKKSGANLQGKSPFTEEKTPSFTVSPAKQIWKDFSSGKGGAGIVSFLMEAKGMSYPESIKYLADRCGDTVQYDETENTEEYRKKTARKDDLRLVLKAVHEKYKEEFKKLDDSHPAKIEVARRGYSTEQVIDWGIGFAPENFLYDLLKNSGRVFQGEELGLIRNGKYKNKYDFYTNRVIYPIHDEAGLLIGFAGRATSPETKNKWLNPTVDESNLLYQKSKVWYGLHRAKFEARKKEEMYIVEGYNDVIAFQEAGLLNTISPCGTAITPNQIQILKRFCTRVNLVMDPDAAGEKAALKHVSVFLEAGFSVYVYKLPKLDPDDFCREYIVQIKEKGLEEILKEKANPQNGFLSLMEAHLVGDVLQRSKGAQEICKVIAKIEDEHTAEIYRNWLAKESKIAGKTIDGFIAAALENVVEEKETTARRFELPKEVKVPLKELYDDISKYGLFMANNQIFMALPEASDGITRFSSQSNFSIEILQHMNDEKFPMKLIRVKNIHNEEKIFDTPSENINTPQAFDNMVTSQGNYRFDGSRAMLLQLRKYLFDKMGVGRKVDVLGAQMDSGLWIWNNRVRDLEGTIIPLDDNGIVEYKGIHYYVPSANKIYRDQPRFFDAQKRFRVQENPTDFGVFLNKMVQVHRDHAISAILFGISSLFQDIVVEKLGSFPILFFYGPGSTGKDELAAATQSFVGVPQVAINLEGNVSTIKAQVREFAQFRNGISQLSEYKRGNPQLDGMLKAIWDRRGYKRGNLESYVGTEAIPIESSAILTGNDFPNEEPLILRLIWNEMTKNEFNQEEMKRFDEFKDMAVHGASGYSDSLLVHRVLYKEKFEGVQRVMKVMLEQALPGAKSRIVQNLSILATTYTLFKDTINFPFTQQEMLEHFKKGADQQIRKINSSSITTRFWEMFITSLRGHIHDRLQVGHIVSMEGATLYFNWMHVYSKIQRMWISHFQEAAPSKTNLMDALERSGVITGNVKNHSYAQGRQGNRTSAIMVNLAALDETTKNDIVGSILFQHTQIENEKAGGPGLWDAPPATPEEIKEIKEEDLPF